MILRNIDLLRSDPTLFILILLFTVIAVVIALTFHELSHGLLAARFGDPTAKRAGRLTLNPVPHLDPLGGLMFLLIGFGWAKPVPVNAMYFGRSAIRKLALVAAAGPLSNLAVAFLASLPFRAGLVQWPFAGTTLSSGGPDLYVGIVLGYIVLYNLLLAAFNLIPLAPLDGSKILPGLLPRDLGEAVHRLEPWGPGILLAVIMVDYVFKFGVLQNTIGPVVNFFASLFVGHRVL
jgi:Zn-dependent protease